MKTSRLISALLIAWSSNLAARPLEASDTSASGRHGATLLFIDFTTKPDVRDARILLAGVAKILEASEMAGRFMVKSITESYAQSEIIFEARFPDCRDTSILADCSIEAAKFQKRRLATRLAGELRALIKNSEGARNSDILGTIVLQTLAYGSISQIYVFTDGIDSVAGVHFRHASSGEVGRYCEALVRGQQAKPLSGTKLVMFGVGRNHDGDRTPLPLSDYFKLKFNWEACLNALGAAAVTIVPQLGEPDDM